MKSLPTNLYELAGFFGIIIAALWGGLQGWKWWLANQKEIYVLKANEAIAQRKQDLLTASQVADLMKQTQEVKKDLIVLREANKEQNEDLIKAIDKIEDNMKSYEELFTKFLIARVNQFDQSLIK